MRKLITYITFGVVISVACTMWGSDATSQQDNSYVALRCQIKQYSIVTAPDVKTLKKNVVEAIAHGWQPSGGVAIAQEGLCQVIVK